MARRVKRLGFPDWLLNNECVISVDTEELNEDGETVVYKTEPMKCIFDEASKTVFTADGKRVTLAGMVIVKGDFAPTLPILSSGTVTINGRTMQIYSAARPRNPDGTVHHTEFEVM